MENQKFTSANTSINATKTKLNDDTFKGLVEKNYEIVVDLYKLTNAIADIISQAEKFKGVYFFTPAANSALRASYDKYHSRDTVEWDENGHHYTARFDVHSTRSHVEAHGVYYKDGKKTTLTAIRNSYKRLCDKVGVENA